MKRFILVILAGLSVHTGPAAADDLADKVDALVTGALGPQTDAERYCRNIADQAAEAKFQWQVKTIAELEDALSKRIAALEKKRAEVEDWLSKREAFMRLAEGNLVGIYEKMRADAAAEQLSKLPATTAAALLLKLKPRTAGTILNEIEPKHAALLTRLLVEAGMTEEKAAEGEADVEGGRT